jgi:hypothetical protein
MMLNQLDKNIFETIVWFDIFDYPLTAWEIYKWGYDRSLNVKAQTSKIEETLEKSEELKKLISQKHGFYFLKWRDDLVRIRKERYLLAEKKYKKLIRITSFIKLVPFIRLIATATGLAYVNAKENDDIDLFIIAKKSKVWTVRFFSVLLLKIFAARPTPANKKDKICLNFFTDEETLNFRKLMLAEENNWSDVYLIYWLAWLYPVFQEGDVWQKFILENNWLKEYLPNYRFQKPANCRCLTMNHFSSLIKKTLEFTFLGKWWENIFHLWQMKIMPRQLKQLANKNSSVIINNQMLKFHDKDRRGEYRKKFYEKVKQIN